jgi:hypothetical protein
MELEVGGDDGGGELGVGSSSGACTPDLGGDVVQLLAVLRIDVLASELITSYWMVLSPAYLVGDDGSACRSGISGDDYAAIV